MPAKTRTSGSKGRRTRTAPRRAKRLAPRPFSALLAEVQSDVDARLRGFLDAKLDGARRHGPEAERLVRAVRDLSLRGGKRLRPALLAVGYRSVDATGPLEPALDAGVALELLQSYFLIHDDWMDDDDVRRGGPSVHAALSAAYRSAERGAHSAILAGDLAAAFSLEALARVEVDAERSPRAMACFSDMQRDAVYGQQLDVSGGARPERVYELKTASYTVRGPLRLGAVLAGAKPPTLRALDRYGLPIGIAFQLRDDVLGLFSDPKKTGKPFANDLRTGKRTALLEVALALTKGRDAKRLSGVVGNARAARSDLAAAVAIIEASGAREVVEKRIAELVRSGLVSLGEPSLTPVGRDWLAGAATALTARER